MLRDELQRLRQMNSNNNTATIPRSVVNAEVSAKLDQVNSWLEVSLPIFMQTVLYLLRILSS